MRVFNLCRALGVFAVCCALIVPGYGQFPAESTGSGVGRPNSGNFGAPLSPMAGGGGMADFSTLMNLIQQTIDPDSWLANGGTSALIEYPAGVYVDPRGHIQRLRETAEPRSDVFAHGASGPRHPWRTSSKLRTISLKRLDQTLFNARKNGLLDSSEVLKLAGLSRIAFVKIDAANEDILLAGPAGEQAMGFQLQDLALVASLVNAQTVPLGCSIEPSDAGILAAQQMLDSPEAVKRLGRNPAMVVEQMQEKIGAHRVRVFGMNANTGTAVALIDADEHMKKIGFGTVATRLPIDSYFDHLDRQSSVPKQSLIRWWFAFADEPIQSNAAGDMFELPQQCVAVMSEQQWVSQLGRQASGHQDPASDAFAQGITEHLGELRTTHPSYARLSAVFESALALQLGIESTGQPSLAAWFPNLCQVGLVTNAEMVEPRTVDGLTTWHRLKNGTIVAVVSGGVRIDARSLATRDKWNKSKFLAGSVVADRPTRMTSAHAEWWWD